MDNDISAVLGGALDTSDAEQGGFEPLPPAWYPVEVEVAEVQKTHAGNGVFLKVKLVVLGDQYAGRVLFARMNLENQNPKAVEIGRRELASLGQACGISAVSDSTQLLGKKIFVRVRVSKEANQFGEYDNDVVGYRGTNDPPTKGAPAKSRGGFADGAKAFAAAVTPEQAAPAAATAKAAAPAAKLPWQK